MILLSYGYVVAEGKIKGVRDEVKEHPMQILVRCDQPSLLAARAFDCETVVEAKLVEPDGHRGAGVLIRTRDADAFLSGSESHRSGETDIQLESVAPADDDVLAVYQYLIGSEGGGE